MIKNGIIINGQIYEAVIDNEPNKVCKRECELYKRCQQTKDIFDDEFHDSICERVFGTIFISFKKVKQ